MVAVALVVFVVSIFTAGALGPDAVDVAAASLLRFAETVGTSGVGTPAVLEVITGSGYGYRRPDGIHVVPIGALGPWGPFSGRLSSSAQPETAEARRPSESSSWPSDTSGKDTFFSSSGSVTAAQS